MGRTLSGKQVLSIKFDTVRLGGGWDDCLGEVELRGIWFFWGNSGNGKTSAVVSLCKELARFGRVLYNSREEYVGLSMQNTLRRYGIGELGSAFQVANLTTEELITKLSQRRSPRFVVIDSFQFMGFNYRTFRDFCDRFPGKLLIFVSRAYGKQPEGRSASSAMYDADCKIWVEGHKAISKGRFIGKAGELVLWEDGARKYWEGRKTEQ